MKKPTKIYRDQYTLEYEIAAGGFATIYKGIEHIDSSNGKQDVAVKVAKRPEPSYVTAIRKEAELIPRFDHTNLVTAYPIKRKGKNPTNFANAIELAGNPVFFVMEYLSGGTLENYLRQVGSLPPAEAATIGLDIARALDHMHRVGFAHNDLKLENIVFRTPVAVGHPFEPVLLDFGIATRVAPPDGGSLYAMSPEQIDQVKMKAPELVHFNAYKVDVWGLGVVLYRMLSGQLPFSGRNEKTLTRSIQFSRPTSLAHLIKDIPSDLDELVIDGCLAKDPNHRITLLELGRELGDRANGAVATQTGDTPQPGLLSKLFGRRSQTQ